MHTLFVDVFFAPVSCHQHIYCYMHNIQSQIVVILVCVLVQAAFAEEGDSEKGRRGECEGEPETAGDERGHLPHQTPRENSVSLSVEIATESKPNQF